MHSQKLDQANEQIFCEHFQLPVNKEGVLSSLVIYAKVYVNSGLEMLHTYIAYWLEMQRKKRTAVIAVERDKMFF